MTTPLGNEDTGQCPDDRNLVSLGEAFCPTTKDGLSVKLSPYIRSVRVTSLGEKHRTCHPMQISHF